MLAVIRASLQLCLMLDNMLPFAGNEGVRGDSDAICRLKPVQVYIRLCNPHC